MGHYFLLPNNSQVILRDSPPPQECAYPECPRREEGYAEKKLLLCSRCKEVQYCDKTCQVPHWKSEHKNLCTGNIQQFKKWLDSRLPIIKWATRHALQVDTTDKILDNYFCLSNQRRTDMLNGWLEHPAAARFIEAGCRKMDDIELSSETTAELFNQSIEETKKLRAEGGIGEAVAVIIVWPLCVFEKIRFEGKPEPRPNYNRAWSAILRGVMNDILDVPPDVLEEMGVTWSPLRELGNGKGKAVESGEAATNGTNKEEGTEEKVSSEQTAE